MLTELLWRACWQGTLLALGVWAVLKLFPKLPASARTTLWWLVCLKLAVGLVPMQPFEVQILPAPAPKLEAASTEDIDPSLQGIVEAEEHSIAPTESAVSSVRKGLLPSSSSAIWLWMWGLGVAGFAVRNGRQILDMRRLLRKARLVSDASILEAAKRLSVTMGLRERPRIRESSSISAPMVVGAWSPTILIPEGFARDMGRSEIEMILAHELAHIQRRDLPAAWIPMLANLFLFFLPTAWIASREWEVEREAACDAMALEATGASAASYGKMLIKLVPIEDQRGPSLAIGATAQFHTLKKRLNMIKTKTPLNRNIRLVAMGLIALSAVLVLPWRATASQTDAAGFTIKPLKSEKAGYWNIDVKIPQFAGSSELADLANRDASAVEKEYQGFLDKAQSESAKPMYETDKPDFQLKRVGKVTMARTNLLSFYWEYRKCPDFFYETTFSGGSAYGIVHGKAKKLEIDDLFLNGADGHKQVARAIYERLKDVFPQQYAKNSQMPAEWEDWNDMAFSISSDRILVHFGKDELRNAGRTENGLPLYFKSEGAYFINIPFSELRGLDKNGPLKGLI